MISSLSRSWDLCIKTCISTVKKWPIKDSVNMGCKKISYFTELPDRIVFDKKSWHLDAFLGISVGSTISVRTSIFFGRFEVRFWRTNSSFGKFEVRIFLVRPNTTMYVLDRHVYLNVDTLSRRAYLKNPRHSTYEKLNINSFQF